MLYLGVDCHKKYSQIAVMDEKGKVKANCKVPNEKVAFKSFLKDVKEPCKAVIEAGRSWGKVHDLLEDDFDIDTIVANPLKVRAIAEASIKTDSIDAKTLAHLLRTDLIPEVHVPPKEIREQKGILRHRIWLVRLQTMTKNRIHQIIDRNHVEDRPVVTLFGKKGKEYLKNLKLPEIDRRLLDDHLLLLDYLEQNVDHMEDWIDETLKENKMVGILDSIPGFGNLFSALAALEIDDINRFPDDSKFASYSCLIPSTHASGGNVYHGRLISSGNRWLKYVFIEAAWAAVRSNLYFKSFYNKFRRNKPANVAIVAVARRISRIAYKCLKENRKYEDRPYNTYMQ
jgi:transposase